MTSGSLRRVLPLLAIPALAFPGCGSADSSGDVGQTTETTTEQCDDLVGVWQADELAGSDEEVGGVYRATLELPARGDANWSESDFIEVWQSWGCVDDKVIGFSDSSARWIDGERVSRDPNPCADTPSSAIRRAETDETIDANSTWVRCRAGLLEEGETIASIAGADTLKRGAFTLDR